MLNGFKQWDPEWLQHDFQTHLGIDWGCSDLGGSVQMVKTCTNHLGQIEGYSSRFQRTTHPQIPKYWRILGGCPTQDSHSRGKWPTSVGCPPRWLLQIHYCCRGFHIPSRQNSSCYIAGYSGIIQMFTCPHGWDSSCKSCVTWIEPWTAFCSAAWIISIVPILSESISIPLIPTFQSPQTISPSISQIPSNFPTSATALRTRPTAPLPSAWRLAGYGSSSLAALMDCRAHQPGHRPPAPIARSRGATATPGAAPRRPHLGLETGRPGRPGRAPQCDVGTPSGTPAPKAGPARGTGRFGTRKRTWLARNLHPVAHYHRSWRRFTMAQRWCMEWFFWGRCFCGGGSGYLLEVTEESSMGRVWKIVIGARRNFQATEIEIVLIFQSRNG